MSRPESDIRFARMLLVTGGRWYAHPVTKTGNTNINFREQHYAVWRNLTWLRERVGFDGVVEGGAIGTDTAAHEWAVEYGLIAVRVRPNPGESPLARNERMYRLWRGNIWNVAAFPGGEGTGHMVRTVERESPTKIWRLPVAEQLELML